MRLVHIRPEVQSLAPNKRDRERHLILAVAGATLLSVPFFSVILGQAEDQSPESGESLGRKVGVSMVTADLGLVSMIRQGILALQLLPSNSSAGQ